MSGITDVARLAGVSKATASRALTGRGYVSASTRSRVEAAAQSLNYVASSNAASLVTGRTQNIGVIMPYLNRWFFAEVLEGIQDALLDARLDLTLYDAKPGSSGRASIFDDFLARKRFDGLIAVGLEPGDREIERLLTIGRPIVSVVGDGGATSAISIDDDNAVSRATDHLIALGHRDIAFVGGDADGHWANVDRRRYGGYVSTMTAAGLADSMVHARSPITLQGGYAASVDLLSDPRSRPTAVVAVCDEVAIGTIIAARRLAIQVPSDLSVIGIDDHEYADMFALTTLQQRPREQGAAAVRLLLQTLAEPTADPVEIKIEPRLIVRNSTAPLRPRVTVATSGSE
ncbi:LacI family DNA-binding transcriptional regulator [Microbacterium sp. P02]|uniref:LacI family DNA-binding transcriptional regulator n=1 Tax=unclassified Microbacterium TaxID=2609290 RepID=UPI00366DE859